MKKTVNFLFLALILIVPGFSLAAGLVPCDTAATCNFTAFMTLVNKVITFILFDLALPIAAIMFAYAGILLITAGGETAHARTKAKKIFINAVIGLILAVACWLIISTILTIMGYNGAWIGLKFGV
jgi:hypothetical protein